MLHLANRRASPRSAGPVEVKAYSNAPRVTLELDGAPVGTVPVVDRIATWPAVNFTPGRHTLHVRDERGTTDSIEWEITP